MSKTAYVITSGSYSDYGVNRVFSSKELAEEWLSEGKDYYDIEEFDLDNMEDKPIAGLMGNIKLDSGKISIYSVLIDTEKLDIITTPYVYSCDRYLVMTFRHNDKEKAAKVLSEKRAQFIADNIEYVPSARYDRENFRILK